MNKYEANFKSLRKYECPDWFRNAKFGIWSICVITSYSIHYTKLYEGCDRYGAYKGVPYDGNDPEFQDFYFNNYEHTNSDKLKDPNKNLMDPNGDVIQGWYTTNEKFHIYWKNVMKEIIDKYEPDLLYSDGGLPFAKQVYELENRNNFV